MKKSYGVIGVVLMFVFGMLGGYLYAVRDRSEKLVEMGNTDPVMREEVKEEVPVRNVKADSTSGVYRSSGGNELFIEAMMGVTILRVNEVEYRGSWDWTEEGAITAMFDTRDGQSVEQMTVVFDNTAVGELTLINPEALGVELTDLTFVAVE